MDAVAVIEELRKSYPDSLIKSMPEENPDEVVCEFDSGKEHPDYSLAVAVIDKSLPHFHKRTLEIYRILRGELRLHVNNEELILYEGQEYSISPGLVHWAQGDQTWVEVYCSPAYTTEDHHMI